MNLTNEQINEVAMLRELLNAQAEYVTFLEKESEKTAVFLHNHHWRYPEGDFKRGEAMRQAIKDAEARLAPAPEEPETSAQIDKCIGNVTEPANPTCANTTHKFSHCDCKEPEVARLREMVMDAARRGDAMAAHWKDRAEKAESIIKQLHHFAGIIEGFQNETK